MGETLNEHSEPRAIVGYWTDVMAIGGLSILLLVPFLIVPRWTGIQFDLQDIVALTILFNAPHFMASYRILYRKGVLKRHPWAGLWVPLGLALYGVVALFVTRWTPAMVDLFTIAAGVYLAWHYTGQAWGMMATFSYIDGRGFEARERKLIVGGLRIMLAWHVVWFTSTIATPEWAAAPVKWLYALACLAAVGSLGMGIAGLVMQARRLGQRPSLRILVPWIAIYLWYLAMFQNMTAIYLVQIFHAIQYLIFPARIELNRHMRTQAGPKPGQWKHTLVWFVMLVLAGFTLLELLGPAVSPTVGALLGASATAHVTHVIFAFVNIHHFFTDGVTWKLRNPEVRETLLAHLDDPRPVRRARPLALRLAVMGVSLLVWVGLGEVALRALGKQPWADIKGFENEPRVLDPHPTRGWALIPGDHTYPNYIPGEPPIRTTVDERGERSTAADAGPQGRPEVLVLGCSFTYGTGINDDETFAWKLQALRPDLKVRNLGTPGYGTIQSLLRLEEATAEGTAPATVLYLFGDFHKFRNVAAMSWLKGLRGRDDRGYGVAPFCTRSDGVLTRHAPTGWASWPGSDRLALIAWLEHFENKVVSRKREAQRNEVTCHLLDAMRQHCETIGSRLLVLMLTDSPGYRAWMEEQGIDFVDVAVSNPKDPTTRVAGEGIHPNGASNDVWLRRFLEQREP